MLLQLLLLAATLTVKASPQAMFANCPDTHIEFCYHGTCRFLVSEWEPSCICFTGYFGSRCQYIDLLQVMAVDPRTFAVVALVVTFLVLLTVTSSTCFGIYLYRKRKKNRKGLLPNTNAPENKTNMADGTVAAIPVLRQTQVNHMSSKDKMEEFKNSVSGPFKHSDDIAALSSKLENLAQNTPLRFSAEAMRPSIICSPRFGNMSNHSFFSRHNPHPHRVTHIQGLNGHPICIVNDEWSVTSPLCPHPMIKNQLNTNLLGVTCSLPIGDPYANKVPFLASGTISEAWRDELKELAAKVGTADKQADKREPEETRRTTQYSAETGRLIPPSSRAMTCRASRRTHRNSNNKEKHPTSIFQDQELLVLELLCQILQTDSLSAIQQWLLLAGPREKDLVMKMIQTATANMKLESNSMDRSVSDRLHSQAALGLISRDQNLQRKDLHRSHKEKPEPIAEEDKPQRIGTAEVLQIHYSSDDENQSKSTSSK